MVKLLTVALVERGFPYASVPHAVDSQHANSVQRACELFPSPEPEPAPAPVQTRSADEPMTTFVTCINCGNRWKFC